MYRKRQSLYTSEPICIEREEGERLPRVLGWRSSPMFNMKHVGENTGENTNNYRIVAEPAIWTSGSLPGLPIRMSGIAI